MIGRFSILSLTLALSCVPIVFSSSSLRTSPISRQLQGVSYFDDIDISEVSLCGCQSCYDKGFSGYRAPTAEASCAQRIMQLIAVEHVPEEAACLQIAKNDYKHECGALCDIDLCDGKAIMNAGEKDQDPSKTFCACAECDQNVWLAMAGEFSCGARISWLVGRGQTSAQACHTVGALEYAEVCGPCNPETCVRDVVVATPNSQSETSAQISHPDINQPSPQPVSEDIPLTPEFPLYCYPPYNERVRYENVWGKYTVEVKESENTCGPSDNLFSKDTVHLQDDELTLQFKKVGDSWMGSEVRVLLPSDEMPFRYGEFSFSLKSVQVIDSASGGVVDTVLPITLIIGLFTWDATESYAIHENYNHEVDIEISRWNTEGLADVQYLVQPPGDPHKYRFFSGEGETYQQAPHTYKFDWRPAEIKWSSSAGGGAHQFTYATQDAIDANAPDYIQCLPADVEVRINMWNLFGNTAPSGLEDTYRVDVVIDSFQFTPSGLTGLPEGGTCSRDCHCDGDAACLSNKCFSAGPATGTQQPLPEGSGSSNIADGSPSEATASAQGQAESSARHGLTGVGEAFLVLFVIAVAVAFGCWIYARNKRSNTDRSRIMMFRVDDETRDGCWEKDTAEDTAELSHESSAFETVLEKGSIGKDHA